MQVQGGNNMKNRINNILANNSWYFEGTATLGRSGPYLNMYWYSYKDDTEDSPVFFSDEEEKTSVKMFKIWNRTNEEYTRVGVLPTGEFIMYTGTISQRRPWGLAPGTTLWCKSYRVRALHEIANELGLNGYETIELVALRCAC